MCWPPVLHSVHWETVLCVKIHYVSHRQSLENLSTFGKVMDIASIPINSSPCILSSWWVEKWRGTLCLVHPCLMKRWCSPNRANSSPHIVKTAGARQVVNRKLCATAYKLFPMNILLPCIENLHALHFLFLHF